MEAKVNKPSQIKTAEIETKFDGPTYHGLYSFIYSLTKNLALSIMRSEEMNTKVSAQGKKFRNSLERQKLEERVNKIVPIYIKRLEELGFPKKNIESETHEKEIKKLLETVK